MNDSKDKSKRHFDLIATNYNTSHDGKFCADMYTPLIEVIHKVKGEKLLDLGCGNGNLLIQLVRNGFALTGVDAFDVLVCNASFHHYPDPEAALKEMHRVLRPGGTLLIGECYMPQPLRAVMNVLIRFSPDGDYHFYGKQELSSLLEAHGFVARSISKTGKHTVLYIARTKERK